ncbi:MAG: vitamin K epoxide reductase family protein [Candidatus Nanopelagicales bacterium]|nr:vitamin K epoxide reductase family protein [Candidatus Nanopelagicales bacterium]MDP4895924.1 vitamin K epoxide reductase family protein [Candidatus Nanopelagicales bacterium]MDP5050343.1 vitamin K epoxide reductase family protein [Candidatus Nanopelagicales bacterium]
METELEINRRSYRQTAWILVVGGIIGIFASIELIIQKISVLSDPTFVPNCDINPVLSCGSVISTEQASLFGFPNPVLGVIGFTVVIMFGALLFAGVELPRSMWLGLNFGALAGVIFVIWLVSQSLYVIGALCPWCMVVWAITIPIFWQVTTDNLASNRLSLGKSLSEIIVTLKWILVAGSYLIIAGLIFIRWSDFWLK